MTRLLVTFLAAFALSGCATDWREVRWVKGTHAEIQAACGGTFRSPVLGCAKHLGSKCTVYTVTVENDARLERILGHEVRHCFEGRFHD